MSRKHKDEDLIDVSEAPTLPPMTTGALEIVSHFQEIDQLSETPEELARQLYDATETRKEAEKLEKKLKKHFSDKYGKGDHMIGGYLVGVAPSDGKRSIKIEDFERYIVAVMGKDALDEARKACISRGDEGSRVTVKRISTPGESLSGGGTGERV